ncbi:Dyp-type peroxidase [Corynebacterium sp. TAE3-ERU12]|uniref:Dyp-type peroxidase n=1 Tax=Corynebacterium sp. TAE3-ERU12 TaxID=2849491 RepID=UPI001C4549A4|nr:Dyp-type peroxidase [Corynebacterium sp. TAE3-ERU12]MBV7295343.1 Dyp-type peroxidase [Corynebacterium sp. TAE3-ERU12]
MSTKFPRRRFLLGFGLGSGAAVMAAPAAQALSWPSPEPEEQLPALQVAKVPFDGEHQAGIDTPRQTNARFVALDLRPDIGVVQLQNLMRLLTADARLLTDGEPIPSDLAHELSVAPANLTITVGLGEGFFRAAGRAEAIPEWLTALPEYPGDELEDRFSGGDLFLQICADDAMTVAHTTRLLLRDAAEYATIRWAQHGELQEPAALAKNEVPRSYMGYQIGIVNPTDKADRDKVVWIDEGPDWLRGGTAVVVRRVLTNINSWQRLPRAEREAVVGRKLDTGAPLTGRVAGDTPRFQDTDIDGQPVIDPNSHIALARPPEELPNQRMLRRSYPFEQTVVGAPAPESDSPQATETIDPFAGTETGTMFVAFQKDPLAQFDQIRQRLGDRDRFLAYTTTVGSAVFVIPRGTGPDEYWAQSLLEPAGSPD